MAISAGSYTVGAAGDYLTWKAAFDDLAGTLTGDLTFTQISDVTLSAQALIPDTFDLAGYTFKITSNTPPYGDPTAGWKTYSTYAEDKVLLMGFVLGAGTVIIEHLYVIAQIDRTSSKYLVAIRCEQDGRVLEFHDCLFDQAGYIGKGIIVSRTDFSTFPKLSMWNCEIFGCINNFACKIADFTYPSGSRMENCIAKTTAQAAFQVTGAGGAEYGIHVKNCVGFAADNTWFLSNAPAVDGDNNGTNLASLPFGSGNKLNLVEADEFVSVNPAEADFWKVKAGNLDNDGVVPSIAGNTKGIRDNDRPGTDGLYSIGSDELEEIIVYGPVYTVGPGQEFSTIQSALDQLWTDQGAATFTASQYIRVFAGTYDENVEPNAGLTPAYGIGYLFILEGDPAAALADVVVQPSSGIGYTSACDQAMLRHLTIDCARSEGDAVQATSGTVVFGVQDCDITSGTASGTGFSALNVSAARSVLVEDSVFTNDKAVGGGAAVFVRPSGYHTLFSRCMFHEIGISKNFYSIYLPGGYSSCRFTDCVFDSLNACTHPVSPGVASILDFVNCTFYETPIPIFAVGGGQIQLVNCISKTSSVALIIYQSGDLPEETSTHFGPRVVMRNNCFHGYSAFLYDLAGNKTYAEFIALNRVDASGDLDATDPLLSNPGSGDFSLQTGSPCRHAGHGSGVTKDINGDPFDPFHPDIGAVSTGIGPNVAYSG
ncbi:hypothetical protein LCGC14_0687240 [marine sediment metagenome]|uniref:Right handed beta helix domain-containing protein n=1 Tax=marine sediment metagenome TaxID=412755 RepID=A0A0F9R6T4_9ZZZZ